MKFAVILVSLGLVPAAYAGDHHPASTLPVPTQTTYVTNNATTINNIGSDCCDTRVNGEFAVRLLDERRLAMELFDSYNFRSQHNDVVGLRMVLKVGTSYADRQILELQKTVKELMTVAHRPGVHQENYYKEPIHFLIKQPIHFPNEGETPNR